VTTNAIKIFTLDQFGENNEFVGSSKGIREVWRSIQLVAPTGAAVLIQGETGTGKELIAQAIHNTSPRRHHRFVAVNCAAIPAALLESELFGHERGAFTGAVASRMGRFQAADRGTLFLDEVGELPIELQPKLLRVIQQHEFERVGSSQTTRVDARIVAATNENLEQMVNERRFRADLYYRLNVFPITLPPLREREGDIALLVDHFVRTAARSHGKSIEHIPDHVMAALLNYAWPGNIRELQNFIERCVILTNDAELRAPISELTNRAARAPGLRTLADADRTHIIATLHETNWVVGGRNGAAARLGLNRTTLIAKMRKLGISRETGGECIAQSNPYAKTASSSLAAIA
jgi:formate hydrogenlyase transcriptional activator